MRRPALLATLLAACSWELPSPAPGPDAGVMGTDARADRTDPNDLAPPLDSPALDVAREDRVDVVAPTDLVVPTDRVAPMDRGGGADVVDAPAGEDHVDAAGPDVVVVPVDVVTTECAPGARRTCYTGPPASRGVGYCRDGVQTCLPTGRWESACASQVLPDCAARVCGGAAPRL